MKRLPINPSFRRKPESSPARCAMADGGVPDPGVRRDDLVIERALNLGRRTAILGIASLLAACTARPVDPERFFRPSLTPPAARPAPGLRIVVEPFQVQGIYADRALVVRDAAGAYRQSIGRSWVGPPSLLLGEALVDYLRAAYGTDAVFPPQTRIVGDVLIRPQLKRFERLQAADGDQALLAVDVVVSGPGGALLGHLVFSESARAGSGPADYVAAQSALLGQASARLLALLDTVLPKVTP